MNGFSLVELIIVVAILGVLAAVVIPMSANATQQAREASLAENLREVRNAIEKYRIEHFGVVPGFPSGDTLATPTEKALIAQLTQTTTTEGVVVANNAGGMVRGPYLAAVPENPMNGSSEIRIMSIGAKDAAMTADDAQGWVYRADDGRFLSNVAGKCLDGKSYQDM